MVYTNKKIRRGITIIELVITCIVGAMITLLIGGLLVAGQRNWLRAFNSANGKVEVDSYTAVLTFNSTGRISNKRDYCLYNISHNGIYTPASPLPSNPVAVVDGNAIEFRYWDTALNASLLDVTKTATAYRLFYLDHTNLMMDEGPYPPGGVNTYGGRITGGNITTQKLAENVVYLQFSHTSKAVVPLNQNMTPGDGSIRMVIGFSDPENNNSITTVRADTFMRNAWP
jgi:hypothetical protein